MSKIMESIHKYVPTHASEGELALPNGATLSTSIFESLFGGDQLSVAPARGVKHLQLGHEITVDCLDGLIPVVEDGTLESFVWR